MLPSITLSPIFNTAPANSSGSTRNFSRTSFPVARDNLSVKAFLLSSGAKGKRFALPNSEIMIHQPSGGARGQATDIEIQARRILQLKDKLNRILAENTGQPLERIQADVERDYFMEPEQAKEYGLIDEILVQIPKNTQQK